MDERYSSGYTREDEYERKMKANRRSKIPFIIMALLIIGSIAVVIFTYVKKNTTYNSCETEAVMSSELNTASKYIRYKDGFIRYTGDGAEAISGSGSTLWNISYGISDPIVDVNGDYAVFADFNHTAMNISDGTGNNISIEANNPIMDVCISANGIVAVWTDSGTGDFISLYSMDGTLQLEIKTYVTDDGFPVALELSPDGRKLVTSYLKVGDKKECWITFYNFGEVGQNYSDKVVGCYSMGEKIVPEFRFIGNDRVGAFYEDGFTLYKLLEIPDVILEKQLEGKIKAICSDDNSFAAFMGTNNGENHIISYDKDGSAIAEFQTGLECTGIEINQNEIILWNNSTCIIYREGGEEKFRMEMDKMVQELYPTAENEKYIIITNDKIEKIKLVSDNDKE